MLRADCVIKAVLRPFRRIVADILPYLPVISLTADNVVVRAGLPMAFSSIPVTHPLERAYEGTYPVLCRDRPPGRSAFHHAFRDAKQQMDMVWHDDVVLPAYCSHNRSAASACVGAAFRHPLTPPTTFSVSTRRRSNREQRRNSWCGLPERRPARSLPPPCPARGRTGSSDRYGR